MTPQQANELLPCPFCGGAAQVNADSDDRGNQVIECSECGADVGANMLNEGIERWNRRAAAPTEPAVDRDSRYRFLLSFLIERGVFHRYDNGVWRLRGIYGVDDSGLKGAGRTVEEALDNAIVAVNLDEQSAEAFWRKSCEAALATPASPAVPEDSSMPVDMSQAKRWIVQLRGRVDSLLAIINAPAVPEPAPLAPSEQQRVMDALIDARAMAMRNTVEARVPESGDFGAIAQNLDWAITTMQASQPTSAEDAAELAEWRRLKDPAVLHVSLLRGLPARLPSYIFQHIAGAASTSAEGKDSERLDWLEQSARIFCGNYTGSGFRMIGSDIWHGTLREAIDGAAMCDMGSIGTGKDTDKEATK